MESPAEVTLNNLNNVCRTCLIERNESEMRSLFEETMDVMLSELTGIKVRISIWSVTVCCYKILSGPSSVIGCRVVPLKAILIYCAPLEFGIYIYIYIKHRYVNDN